MWITRVSIANPVFATMVMVALLVLGVFSYTKLGVEQMPDINFPGAFIDVAYPGASPEAVEREVSKLVEEALNSIAGVKRITSRSFEGRSQTSVEFNTPTCRGPCRTCATAWHKSSRVCRATPRSPRFRASTPKTPSRSW